MTNITDAQLKCIIDIFVERFSNEPSFKYMFPTDTERKTRWIAKIKFNLLKEKYQFFTEFDGGKVKGFACWLPPNAGTAKILEQLLAGHLFSPFFVGLSSFSKMIFFSNQENEILKRYHNHWILDVIAVSQHYERQGIGGILMSQVQKKSLKTLTPCFVLTHNPRNVEFYQKYGFKLVVEEPTAKNITAYGLEYLSY